MHGIDLASHPPAAGICLAQNDVQPGSKQKGLEFIVPQIRLGSFEGFSVAQVGNLQIRRCTKLKARKQWHQNNEEGGTCVGISTPYVVEIGAGSLCF